MTIDTARQINADELTSGDNVTGHMHRTSREVPFGKTLTVDTISPSNTNTLQLSLIDAEGVRSTMSVSRDHIFTVVTASR